MTSGKYFNRGVKALDSPDIGYVVRETPDKIIVFGGGDERFDIPISEVQQVGANVLIGLKVYDIVRKYKVSRKEPLPTSRQDPWSSAASHIDLEHMKKSIPNPYLIKELEPRTKTM